MMIQKTIERRTADGASISPWPYPTLIAVLTAALIAMASPVAAQDVVITADYFEPAAAIAALERGTPESVRLAADAIIHAFGRLYERYSETQRQWLLDGVERVASAEGDDVVRPGGPRPTAVTILTTLALDPTLNARDRRGIPHRLLRVFRTTPNPFIRASYCGDLPMWPSSTPGAPPRSLVSSPRSHRLRKRRASTCR